VVLTGTENRGLTPEKEPEKRLLLLRKAAGAQISQCQIGEEVTKNINAGRSKRLAIEMRTSDNT